MAKVYESRAARQLIPVPRKDGKGCNLLRFEAGSKFHLGVLVLDAATLKAAGLTESEAVEIIESTPEFIGRQPGKAGIWLKEQRLDGQVNAAQASIRKALDEYPIDLLRKELQERKVGYPVGADQKELADLLYKAMTGSKDLPDAIAAEPVQAQPSVIKRGIQTR